MQGMHIAIDLVEWDYVDSEGYKCQILQHEQLDNISRSTCRKSFDVILPV